MSGKILKFYKNPNKNLFVARLEENIVYLEDCEDDLILDSIYLKLLEAKLLYQKYYNGLEEVVVADEEEEDEEE